MKVIDTESFIEKAKSIHDNYYDYSNTTYYKSKLKLSIICPKHGYFEQVAADHLKGYGCSKCSGKYKPNTEEWIKKAKLISPYYDYSKVNYIDNKTPITIICKNHGEFYPIPNNFMRGSLCPKCNDVLKHNKYTKTTEQFIKDAINIHKNLYDYSKVNYISKVKKITIICEEHGEFNTSPSSHLKGSGCPKCVLKNQSRLFEKLKMSFKDINFLWEYSPDWLNRQRFDIYNNDLNLAIEYQGQQHYYPIKKFGGEIKFQETKINDELKRQKCKDNNCALFEVKYDYNENDYETLVSNIKSIIKLKKKNEGKT